MNGWSTELAIWEEDSILGAQTGSAYSPPGITQIDVQPISVESWETIDPLRGRKTEETLRRAWRIRLIRQWDKNVFSDFWLTAMTDTNPTITSFVVGSTVIGQAVRNLIDNPTMRTFGMEFILEDGNQRRYSGMAVERVEYTLQSGRVIMEEVTLIALASEEFAGAVRAYTAQAHVIHSGINAYFNLRRGDTWGSPHSLDRQTTFSSQLIFQREFSPAQFNASGRATKFAVRGGWEFLGRVVTRSPTLWADFHDTTRCVAQWNFGTSTNYLDIQANVNARLSSHPILVNGQIDTNIDFQAFRYGRSLFQLIKRSQS